MESNFKIDSKNRTEQLGKIAFCRLCLCISNSLIDVFDLKNNHCFSVKETIEDLLQFKVIKENGCPWLTCDNCREKLNSFRRFKISCIESKIVIENRFLHPGTLAVNNRQAVDAVVSQKRDEKKSSGKCPPKVAHLLEPSTYMTSTPPPATLVPPNTKAPVPTAATKVIQRDNKSLQLIEPSGEGDRTVAVEHQPPTFILLQVTPAPVNTFQLQPASLGQTLNPTYCTAVMNGRYADASRLNFEMMEEFGLRTEVCETSENLLVPKLGLDPAVSAKGEESGTLLDDTQLRTKDDDEVEESSTDTGVLCEDDGTLLIDCDGELVEHENAEPGMEMETVTTSVETLSVPNIMPLESLVLTSGSITLTTHDKQGIQTEAVPNNSDSITRDPDGEFLDSSLGELVTIDLDDDIAQFVLKKTSPKTKRKKHCKNIGREKTGTEDVNNLDLHAYECLMCSEKFGMPGILTLHKLSHSDDPKPYKCLICPKTFSDRRSQVRHRLRHYNVPRRFVCEVCDEVFRKHHHLNNHMRDHIEGTKTYVCKICKQVFNSRYKRDNHVTSHSGLEFRCPICDKVFPVKGKLDYHIQGHQDKSLLCEVCGKEFKRPQLLNIHQRLHNDVKRYNCQECGAKFAQYSALWQHKKWHEGNKKFVCDICDKGFVLNCQLRQHKKRHVNAISKGVRKTKAKNCTTENGVAREIS